jgi:uncharacterized membrane protein
MAVLLTIPAVVMPPMTHDSFWIDWVWADQFTAEIARGNLYPRWLPQSHGGLGSPAFYYYPPLAFYVCAAFGLAGLSTYASIIAAFCAGLAASGFAMHAWLRGSARNPLLGALLYMAAPYHLLDFYGRGALAELIAIAFIPLVALGLRRALEGRPALAALSYAGLILSHLPLALLASIFFIAPNLLYLSRGAVKPLARLAAPLAIGLGLAAIYLLPAISLEPYRDAAKLWADSSLIASNWSVLAWNVPGPAPGMRKVIAMILVMLVIAAMLLLRTPQRRWGAYALACCALAAGIVPAMWDLPLLKSVQFPFRMLPLAEFAVATAVAHVGLTRPWATTAALAVLSMVIALSPARKVEFSIAALAADHPEVPENLPPGDRPYAWPSEWALAVARDYPQAQRLGRHTVEPVFYFPSWQVRCRGVPVVAFPESGRKLLAHPGFGCQRRLALTSPEKTGAAISLAALLALIALLMLRRSDGAAE